MLQGRPAASDNGVVCWRRGPAPAQWVARGSVHRARMEAGAVSHALTGLWIVNTGSASQVSVVVVYATGGWTVVRKGKVELYSQAGARHLVVPVFSVGPGGARN